MFCYICQFRKDKILFIEEITGENPLVMKTLQDKDNFLDLRVSFKSGLNSSNNLMRELVSSEFFV